MVPGGTENRLSLLSARVMRGSFETEKTSSSISSAVGQKQGFNNPLDYRKYGKMKGVKVLLMITFLIVTSNTRQRKMENQYLYPP